MVILKITGDILCFELLYLMKFLVHIFVWALHLAFYSLLIETKVVNLIYLFIYELLTSLYLLYSCQLIAVILYYNILLNWWRDNIFLNKIKHLCRYNKIQDLFGSIQTRYLILHKHMFILFASHMYTHSYRCYSLLPPL